MQKPKTCDGPWLIPVTMDERHGWGEDVPAATVVHVPVGKLRAILSEADIALDERNRAYQEVRGYVELRRRIQELCSHAERYSEDGSALKRFVADVKDALAKGPL